MPVNRDLWRRSFQRDTMPGLPCPHCMFGKLKLIPKSFEFEEPTFSQIMKNEEEWEPDWIERRFSARLRCDEDECGEIVSVAGDTELIQASYEEPNGRVVSRYEELLKPRAIFPAPHFFRLPKKIPYRVKYQLTLAFQLYWMDLAVSAGRLRATVEVVLEDKKIPTTSTAKSGNTIWMALAERIEIFASSATNFASKDALHGLRFIGNLGTHGDRVSLAAFFDAVDVLEDVLLEVYENKSISAKTKKLIDNRGDY